MFALASPARSGILPDGAFSAKAAGSTGAAFLRDPFGARTAAMGGTLAASSQGAESLFLNPAALARMEPESPSEVSVGYDALVESAYQGSAAYARPLGRDGALAAGFVDQSQSAQTTYDALGNANGSFTPMDLAAGVGYARRVGPVAIGAGVKAIRSTLSTLHGTTGAVDFGVLARHVTDLGEGPLDVGGAVSNLGPPLKLGSTADPLPLRARAGGLWHASPNFDAALDVVFPVDQDPYVTMGFEARFPAAMVNSAKPWSAALRAGYDQNRGRDVDGFAGASFGAGLDMAAVRVDYAWVALGALGSANRVTLAFRF
ncbi:MAG: PorV/PorQ family protein [Elusimicrobia bacterium]|nr:PorV/PorQ family protein [Elusimicrobiota bacterium]